MIIDHTYIDVDAESLVEEKEDADDDGDCDDIYIMMKCLFVCNEKSSLP